MSKILIESPDQWHELRKSVIGSSDIACLYGWSMYKSKYALWHEKAGHFSQDITNNRIQSGIYLEDAIAKMVADKEQIDIKKCDYFYQKNKLGATPDYIGRDNDVIIEIKNMDYIQFKEKCCDGVPPRQYILQLQHQMHCTGVTKGILAIFVGGNDLRLFACDYRPFLGESMEKEADYFFQSIQENKAPTIEETKDLEVAKSIYSEDNRHYDCDDQQIEKICSDLEYFSSQRKHFESAEKIEKARLLNHLNGYNTASICGKYNIRVTKTKDSQGTIITQDMVGKAINARKGSIKLTLKEI